VQPLNPPKHKILIEIPPYYIDTLIRNTMEPKMNLEKRREKWHLLKLSMVLLKLLLPMGFIISLKEDRTQFVGFSGSLW
jgi:hypothetical protein